MNSNQPRYEHLFSFHHGLHLKGTLLSFDALRPQGMNFISNALVSPQKGFERIIATKPTVDLLSGLSKKAADSITSAPPLTTPYYQRFSLGTMSLELIPGGPMPGSASLCVTHQGLRILYASHLRQDNTQKTPSYEARTADILVLAHANVGTAESASTTSSRDEIEQFVKKTLAQAKWPVITCSTMDEAPIITNDLTQQGYQPWVHPSIEQVCSVYKKLLPARYCAQPQCYNERQMRQTHANPIIWPQTTTKLVSRFWTKRLTAGKRLPTALMPQMPQLFAPLSQKTWLDFIESTQAKQVVFVTHFPQPLATALQKRNVTVNYIGPKQQLQLFAATAQ